MTDAELQTLLQRHVADLMEHFDSVRIFVTLHSDDGSKDTKQLDQGDGNFYAQLGQVHEWLDIQREYQRVWARNHSKPDEP
jgi:hypothetical protein